jgi:hypothetical protein
MNTDPDIDIVKPADIVEYMQNEYNRLLAEQEQVKKVGYRLNDYCWNCKKFFPKLGYKICANGYITYWCEKCY